MEIPIQVQEVVAHRLSVLEGRGEPGAMGYGTAGRFTTTERYAICMFPPYDSWHFLGGKWALTGFGVRVHGHVYMWSRDRAGVATITPKSSEDAGPRWKGIEDLDEGAGMSTPKEGL